MSKVKLGSSVLAKINSQIDFKVYLHFCFKLCICENVINLGSNSELVYSFFLVAKKRRGGGHNYIPMNRIFKLPPK